MGEDFFVWFWRATLSTLVLASKVMLFWILQKQRETNKAIADSHDEMARRTREELQRCLAMQAKCAAGARRKRRRRLHAKGQAPRKKR